MKEKLLFFSDSVIFSYGQIFFSNRRWFGVIALLSTFIMPVMGVMGLLGAALTNLLALYLRFDKTKIRNGFYGFNGILLATAASFYYELNTFVVFLIIVFIILTFFISAVLENYLAVSFNLPGLSLPFILAIYIFLIFVSTLHGVQYKGLVFTGYEFFEVLAQPVITFFKSYSLILFQHTTLTGVILAAAVLMFSRIMFINSVLAYLINYAFVHIIFGQPTDTMLILTSFNAILTSFALGGALIILSKKTVFLIILSTLMVIIFTGFFSQVLVNWYLPVLVLPFNIVTLATIYSLKFRQEQSDMVLLYFQPGSAEENFYYHDNRKSRFEEFRFLFPELPFFGEWTVSQGFEGEFTHKKDWKHAWDFILTENGEQYAGSGNTLTDYYCYDTPVAAPLDGRVARIMDNIPDNEIGEVNLKYNWGNTVIIRHDDNLYSALSHLKPGSVKVKEGDDIKKGTIIANCGNSGRSPYPHLHFQFQRTDKIGDKTFKFPFAHYLAGEGESLRLHTFEYPAEGTRVRNIETHKILKNAFAFKLYEEYKVVIQKDGKETIEEWSVNVDIMNLMYIENNSGDRVYLHPSEKVFYIANYVGHKDSALYYFYLLGISVPLGYYKNLVWKDSYSPAVTMRNLTRYISEFFLVFGKQFVSEAELGFTEPDEPGKKFAVITKTANRGKKLFSFYKTEGNGKLYISENGSLTGFEYKSKKENVSAVITNKRDEE